MSSTAFRFQKPFCVEHLPNHTEDEARALTLLTRNAISRLESHKVLVPELQDDSLAKELIMRVLIASRGVNRVVNNDNYYFRALFNLTAHQETRRRLTNLNVVGVLIEALTVQENPVLIATLSNLAYEERTKHDIMKQHDGAALFVRLLHSSDSAVLAHAARGIFSLTTVYDYKLELAHAGAIDPLITCLAFEPFCEQLAMNAAGVRCAHRMLAELTPPAHAHMKRPWPTLPFTPKTKSPSSSAAA